MPVWLLYLPTIIDTLLRVAKFLVELNDKDAAKEAKDCLKKTMEDCKT